MAVQWVVHSFHININTGDSAVHCLVTSATPPLPRPWTVQRAVLIDGGVPGESAGSTNHWRDISRLAGWIAANYNLPALPGGGPATLQFDAVIITHWDKDHWGGILQLIRSDLSQQIDQQWFQNLTAEQAEARKQNYVASKISFITGLHPTFFKYAPGAAPAPAPAPGVPPPGYPPTPAGTGPGIAVRIPVNQPNRQWWVPNPLPPLPQAFDLLTTVYLPDDVMPSWDQENRYVDSPSWALRLNHQWPPGTGQDYDINLADNILSFTFTLSNDTRPLRQRTRYTTMAIGKVVTTSNDINQLLGREIFYGTNITAADLPAPVVPPALGVNYLHHVLTHPGILIQAQRNARNRIWAARVADIATATAAAAAAAAAGGPAVPIPPALPAQPPDIAPFMYILAGGGRWDGAGIAHAVSIIGNIADAPRMERPLIDDDSLRDDAVQTNAKSILCVILAATFGAAAGTGPAPLNGFRLMHYFGGDATYNTEAGVATWLIRPTGLTGNIHLQAPVMKMNHHGSLSSTPLSLLNLLKPVKLIVPNGPLYGHPRWEFVFFLKVFYEKLRLDSGNNLPYPTPFYPLQFPHYLIGTRSQNAGVVTHTFDAANFSMPTMNLYREYKRNTNPYILPLGIQVRGNLALTPAIPAAGIPAGGMALPTGTTLETTPGAPVEALTVNSWIMPAVPPGTLGITHGAIPRRPADNAAQRPFYYFDDQMMLTLCRMGLRGSNDDMFTLLQDDIATLNARFPGEELNVLAARLIFDRWSLLSMVNADFQPDPLAVGPGLVRHYRRSKQILAYRVILDPLQALFDPTRPDYLNVPLDYIDENLTRQTFFPVAFMGAPHIPPPAPGPHGGGPAPPAPPGPPAPGPPAPGPPAPGPPAPGPPAPGPPAPAPPAPAPAPGGGGTGGGGTGGGGTGGGGTGGGGTGGGGTGGGGTGGGGTGGGGTGGGTTGGTGTGGRTTTGGDGDDPLEEEDPLTFGPFPQPSYAVPNTNRTGNDNAKRQRPNPSISISVIDDSEDGDSSAKRMRFYQPNRMPIDEDGEAGDYSSSSSSQLYWYPRYPHLAASEVEHFVSQGQTPPTLSQIAGPRTQFNGVFWSRSSHDTGSSTDQQPFELDSLNTEPNPAPTALFLLSADYDSPSSTTEYLLSEDSSDLPFNNFVANLSVGSLTLEKPLAATGSELARRDEWMNRLCYNRFGITKVLLYGSVLPNNSRAQVTQIDMILSRPGYGIDDTDISAVTSIPMIFSSQANPSVFGFDTWLVEDYNVLVLGLKQSDQPQGWTFSQFAQVFHIKIPRLAGIAEDFASMYTGQTVLQIGPTKDDKGTTRQSLSALFFLPDQCYTSVMRLEFAVNQDLVNRISKIIGQCLSGVELRDVRLIGRMTSRTEPRGNNANTYLSSEIIFTATIVLEDANGKELGTLKSWLVYKADTIQVIVRWTASTDSSGFLAWIASQFTNSSISDFDPASILGSTSNDSSFDFAIRQVTFEIASSDSNSSTMKLQGVTVDFELGFKTPAHGKKGVFQLSFTYPNPYFMARLYCPLPTLISDPRTQQLLPSYEEYLDLKPNTETLEALKLSDFIPNMPSAPNGMDTISDLSLELWRTNATKGIRFRGGVQSPPPDNSKEGNIPQVSLDHVTFIAEYEAPLKDFKNNTSTYMVRLEAEIVLYPREYHQGPEAGDGFFPYAPTTASVSVEYTNNAWILELAVSNARFSTLYSLFDSSASEHLMDILEHFSIPTLIATYQYSKSGAASSLSIEGSLVVGPLELDLAYQSSSVAKGSPEWSLDAHLGSSSMNGTTVGKVVEQIAGDDADLTELLEASFVGDIEIPAAGGNDAGFNDSPIQLSVRKSDSNLLFWIRLRIAGGLYLSFYQILSQPSNESDGSQNSSATKRQPKRIITFTASKLPDFNGIPVVDKLAQPFDELDYIWVQDPNSTSRKTGITRSEINEINDALQNAGASYQIRFKETTKAGDPRQSEMKTAEQPSTSANDDLVLLAGHHFSIICDGRVVLDYIFGQKDETTPRGGGDAGSGPASEGGDTTDDLAGAPDDSTPSALDGKDSGVSMAASKRSIGPLTISNIGLQMKGRTLFLHLDATVELGPIEFTLIGFAIGVKLDKFNLDSLSSLRPSDFAVDLSGMSVLYNSPPISAAGVFSHIDNDEFEKYQGGVVVGMTPYLLEAVGAYQRDKKLDFKSVFIFASLDGPLVELEFASIKGVRFGFGYNYHLALPTVAQVPKFPLISDATAQADPATKNDPMQRLVSFGQWQHAQQRSLWIAAGLTVTAFQTLTITAVIFLSFDPRPTLSIIGVAVASLPPNVPEPRLAILYVELGIIGTLDIAGGSLRIEAQLTPNSFILNPSCRLTGGFGLCKWFEGSGHNGDFVFTVGGFHARYKVPVHYPNPPRVGVSWQYDKMTSIRGEAYFAITPKVAMAGGRLRIMYDLGVLHAWLEVWADFLINYVPFYMMVEAGVSVGVEFELDLWLVTIHISASVGATIHLEGPEFGGWVYVDFYLFGFTVYFGAKITSLPATMPEFLNMLEGPAPGGAASNSRATTNARFITVTLQAGTIPELNDKIDNAADDKDETWHVRAGTFQFRVESKFAVSNIDVNDNPTINSPYAVYAKPMHINTPMYSQLVVSIDTETEEGFGWNVTPIEKQMPAGIWGPYDSNNDPVQKGNQIFDLLTVPSTTDKASSEPLLTEYAGATVFSPYPHLSTDCLPEFNAQQAMNAGVFNAIADHPFLNPSAGTQNLWLPDPDKPPQSDQNVGFDSQAWNNLRSAWLNAPKEEGQAVADLYASALGWDAEFPQAVNSAPSSTSGNSLPSDPTTAPIDTPSDDKRTDPVDQSEKDPPPPAPIAQTTWVPLKAQPPVNLLKVATVTDGANEVGTGLLEVYYLSVPGFAKKFDGFGVVSPIAAST